MRRPHVAESLGLGFDHRAEVVAAIGALLLQVEADRGQVVVADRFGRQGTVARGTQSALDGVRGEQDASGRPHRLAQLGPLAPN